MLFSDTAGKDSGDGDITRKRLFDPFAGTWIGEDVSGLATLPSTYDRGSAATSVLLPLLPPLYRARVLACNSPACHRVPHRRRRLSDLGGRPPAARVPPPVATARTPARRSCPPARSWSPAAGRVAQARTTSTKRRSSPSFTRRASTGPPATSPTTGDEDVGDDRRPGAEPPRLPLHRAAAARRTGVARRLDHDRRTAQQGDRPLRAAPTSAMAGRPSDHQSRRRASATTPRSACRPRRRAASQRVALLRCGSITHGFNSDQRYVGLDVQRHRQHRAERGRAAQRARRAARLLHAVAHRRRRATLPARGIHPCVLAEARALRRRLDVLDPRGRRARLAGRVPTAPYTSSPTASCRPRSRTPTHRPAVHGQ